MSLLGTLSNDSLSPYKYERITISNLNIQRVISIPDNFRL